jgi:hypothetical protein
VAAGDQAASSRSYRRPHVKFDELSQRARRSTVQQPLPHRRRLPIDTEL